MKRGIVLLLACLVASLAVPASPAHGSASVLDLTLDGTNVLSGSKSFTREVVLPAPATISDAVLGNKDIKISGGGRVVGFSLVEADAKVTPTELNALQFRFCSYRGCRSAKTQRFLAAHALGSNPNDNEDLMLRPGRYFLSFIADGAPAKVTFKLDGLAGTARFDNGKVLRHEISPLDKEFESPNGMAFAAGSINRVPEDGITMVALQGQAEVSAGGFYGACLRKRDRGPADPPEQEYAPLCETDGTLASGAAGGPTAPKAERVVTAHWVTVDQARLSHGVWARTLAPDVDMQTLSFWMAYPAGIDRTGQASIYIGWDD